MSKSVIRTARDVLVVVVITSATLALGNAPSKSQYGSWGFDATGVDARTKPGDDFFRYANGAWLDKTPIPEDKPGYSLRLAMTDRTEGRLHDLMETAAKTAAHEPRMLEEKIGAFYSAFMDEKRIDALGAKAIAPELDAIRAANDRSKIASLMGQSNADFYGTLFVTVTDIDLKDPRRYAVYLTQDGLALPDRDYYLKPGFAQQKAKLETYAALMLKLAGWPDAETTAKSVVDLQTAIAEASWTKTQQRDPLATYNPMSVAELEKFAPGFDWRAFFGAADLAKLERPIIAEKSAFPKLTAIFAATPVKTLQADLAFTVLDNSGPYLSKRFADAWFDMHGRTLSGQQMQRARWKRAVTAVAGGDYGGGDHWDRFGNLGWAVGELYTARYFPPSAKVKIEELVANLKAAYRSRLVANDWMSPSTKKEALRKLDTYNIKVGYPDHNRDYGTLIIRDDDLVGDVKRAASADWSFFVGRLFGPVDRTDWSMTPQTNDAYNGSLRDIVFPAGILQAPVFDAAADPAINYGAIGGIIGHEMTHGFDDQGRKIDASGALRDWWAPSDAKTFAARAAKLGGQYSVFEPVPGAHVNGDLTMGENIADLGGLTLALDAYHRSLKGKPAPVIDGMSGDQRVFFGWAQAWRGKFRDAFVRKQVVSDPHSPRQYRVNGVVRNIDAWYASFGVKPGDKLYVAPEDRVHIW
jgi:putative endopeptidase